MGLAGAWWRGWRADLLDGELLVGLHLYLARLLLGFLLDERNLRPDEQTGFVSAMSSLGSVR